MDLRDTYHYIAAAAGEPVAARYIARIEAYCRGFVDFPARGTMRNHLRQGMRTIGFERRMTIVFHISGRTVVFDRFLYGGRNIGAPLGE